MTNENITNQAWCPIPWIHLHIKLDGVYQICNHTNTHFSKGLLCDKSGKPITAVKTNVKAIRNHPTLKKIRKEMLEGIRPKECKRCNINDDAGIVSRRIHERENLFRIMGFTLEKAKKNTLVDGSVNCDIIPLVDYDIGFSNLCNLSCRMCYPTSSSGLYKEYFETISDTYYEGEKPIKLIEHAGNIIEENNRFNWAKESNIFSHLEKNCHSIKRIHFDGGEPLLIKEFDKVINICLKNKSEQNIIIDINTNGVIPLTKFLKVCKNFKKVNLRVSIDGPPKVNSYIRYPAKWDNIIKNISSINLKENKNVSLAIATTVQNYNIYYITDLLKWVLSLDRDKFNTKNQSPFLTAHFVHTPLHWNIQSLPKHIKIEIENKFIHFYNNWFKTYVKRLPEEERAFHFTKMKELLDGIINYMFEHDKSIHFKDFFKFTKIMDSYRNESFSKTFHEFNHLLNIKSKSKSKSKSKRYSFVDFGIISSSKDDLWFSADIISKNILKGYKTFIDQNSCIYYNYFIGIGPSKLLNLARKILKDRPKKIVIINPRPHPEELLTKIFKIDPSYCPEIYIHVYGNFVHYSGKWSNFNSFIKNRKVNLILASKSHVNLVKNVCSKKVTLHYCPFPVNNKQFYFNNELRKSFRKKYKLNKDDLIFVYSGRVTLQKNVIKLLKIFDQAIQSNPNIFLFIAGPFDDIFIPFFNIDWPDGYFFEYFMEELKLLSKKAQKNIIITGHLNHSELSKLYNGADCLVSLSTHHTEDYGLAVAEGLCSGLPAILTNWGGYSSFYKGSDKVKLIDVKITESGINIDELSTLKAIRNFNQNRSAISQRKYLSKLYISHFGISSMKNYHKNIYNKKSVIFKGFSPLIIELANSIKKGFKSPTENSFYYRSYGKFMANRD